MFPWIKKAKSQQQFQNRTTSILCYFHIMIWKATFNGHFPSTKTGSKALKRKANRWVGQRTLMGLRRLGLVILSQIMPAMAMPTHSQVKKLNRLMTEKMSLEMAYIMDSRHWREGGGRREGKCSGFKSHSLHQLTCRRAWARCPTCSSITLTRQAFWWHES